MSAAPMTIRIESCYDTDPVLNEMESIIYCQRCHREHKAGRAGEQSPAEYARTQVGLRGDGALQVWCVRHDCNVAVITIVAKVNDDPRHVVSLFTGKPREEGHG